MTAAAPAPPVVATPETVVINGFVIETYPAISQVPFASVSDQRGKAMKTSEHERYDELYGRCRICMGHKSGEQLLLCDICDRGYHMTCLIPALRDVPKGEWHCSNCTRERKYTFHARATAIATMRRVLNDIKARPTLPPRLKLKMLNVPSPLVQFNHVPASAKSTSQQLQNDTPPYQDRAPKTLPPKCRMKNAAADKPEASESEGPEKTILYKKVAGESLQQRRDHVSRLATDLLPVADYFDDEAIVSSLDDMQTTLVWADHDRPEDEFVETRTSDNSLTKANKRARIDVEDRNRNISKWINYGENSTPLQPTPSVNGRLHSTLHNSEKRVEDQKIESDLDTLVAPSNARPAINRN